MEIKSHVSRASFGHVYDAKTLPCESFIAKLEHAKNRLAP